MNSSPICPKCGGRLLLLRESTEVFLISPDSTAMFTPFPETSDTPVSVPEISYKLICYACKKYYPCTITGGKIYLNDTSALDSLGKKLSDTV